MKTTISIIVCLLFFSSKACDMCGGVSGNASIGLFAANQFHYLGLRSNFRDYSLYMHGIRQADQLIFTQEINFRYQFTNRIQCYGEIPYQYGIEKTDLKSEKSFGFGDPNLLLNFILINKKDSISQRFHFASIGIGVKAPIGKMRSGSNSLTYIAPGTGSWDSKFHFNYIFSPKTNFGFQNEISLSVKGSNPIGLRRSNVSTFSSQFYTNKSLLGYRLISSCGINMDYFFNLKSNNNALVYQGIVIAPKASFNLITNKMLFGLQVQRGLIQNINQGELRQKWSFSLTINYLLKNKKK